MNSFFKAVSLVALFSASALAQGNFNISAARMSERTTANVSYNFSQISARREDIAVGVNFSIGIGAALWDGGHQNEGRLHADARITLNRVYFSTGPFATSGNKGGVALGIRTALGYQSIYRFFVGGYWEAAAGLPGTSRSSKGGLGIQAGFRL